MRKHSEVNPGNGPITAIAVLVAGLMAIGIVFGVLGGALYLGKQPTPNMPSQPFLPGRRKQPTLPKDGEPHDANDWQAL